MNDQTKIRLTRRFVLEALLGQRIEGFNEPIWAVVIDSRETIPGSAFFAFAGENVDGHDYAAEAAAAGASLIVHERDLYIEGSQLFNGEQITVVKAEDGGAIYAQVQSSLEALQTVARAWREQLQQLRTIGITGSVGKTTTKELTFNVLRQGFQTVKSQGNYNNEIGLPLTLLEVSPEDERAILEMGMYARGEIARLCEIGQPTIGVVTNISEVHLDRLGSLEAIRLAKQELVEALPEDGYAVLNLDDPLVTEMAGHTSAKVFTYGLNNQADIWASEIVSMGLSGVSFNLHYQGDTLAVTVPLLGRHSVHTALRATAVGLIEGLSWDQIVRGLQGMSEQLRLVAVPGPADSVILDDTYNSSPESAVAALNLLADLDGRKIAMLGDMLELGQAEEEGHRLVGRRAAGVADLIIAVGSRGRLIGEEALNVGFSSDKVFIVEGTVEAEIILRQLARPMDVILIKASRALGLDQIVSALATG